MPEITSFCILSFRWKTSDTNLQRRSLLPRSFWKDTPKGIEDHRAVSQGCTTCQGRQGHTGGWEGGSHAVWAQDQDKRDGGEQWVSAVSSHGRQPEVALRAPPWPMYGIQEISMSLSTDRWSPPIDFTMLQMTVTSAVWDSYDPGRPDRPHWSSLVSQPSRSNSVRKPHPLTVDS